LRERLHQPVGWFKSLTALICLIISFCNIMLTIQKGYSLESTFLLWGSFLLIGVALFIFDVRSVFFIASLGFGTVTLIIQKEKADLESIAFFLVALRMFNDKISLLVIIFSIFAGVMGRALLLSMNFYETAMLFLGHIAFVLAFYVPIIYKGDEGV